MNPLHVLLSILRKSYGIIHREKSEFFPRMEDYDEISNLIQEKIASNRPFMIARMGAFELSVVVNYVSMKGVHNFFSYVKGEQEQWWWNVKLLHSFCNNAGFFPLDYALVEQYCEQTIKDMEEVDVLISWQSKELLFKEQFAKAAFISLPGVEPFWSEIPWSRALKGKKVVVVHPFTKTIKKQYRIREKLFFNQEVLPDFSLRLVEAVQSIGGSSIQYANWFEALEYMKKEIDKEDYDICLIGCGAYGFSLAAHVKGSGKQAIHMGGALQLLFGIKGQRWENAGQSRYFNEYWCYSEEKPTNYNNVENGCYW